MNPQVGSFCSVLLFSTKVFIIVISDRLFDSSQEAVHLSAGLQHLWSMWVEHLFIASLCESAAGSCRGAQHLQSGRHQSASVSLLPAVTSADVGYRS
jgi:hypothetical protein